MRFIGRTPAATGEDGSPATLSEVAYLEDSEEAEAVEEEPFAD